MKKQPRQTNEASKKAKRRAILAALSAIAIGLFAVFVSAAVLRNPEVFANFPAGELRGSPVTPVNAVLILGIGFVTLVVGAILLWKTLTR